MILAFGPEIDAFNPLVAALDVIQPFGDYVTVAKPQRAMMWVIFLYRRFLPWAMTA
jgi:hypothetical protein